MFPLGEIASKSEVRAEAAARGLGVSNKPDSYDICFVADGDTKGFLERALGEKPGEIVDEAGEVVGAHSGAYAYTVGQRKGLRLPRPAADGAPRYVTGIDTERNVVTVGPETLLSVRELVGEQTVWLAPDVPALDADAMPGAGAGRTGSRRRNGTCAWATASRWRSMSRCVAWRQGSRSWSTTAPGCWARRPSPSAT